VAAAGDGPARLVAARLEHVARWEQVRLLGDHPSPLADAVALEVIAADDSQTPRPTGRAPLPSDGGYRLEYRHGPGGTWIAPYVYLVVRNRSAADLWVAVLDLTDRFRCHAVLETTLVGAGVELSLEDRRPIPVALPVGRPLVPGATARDWLKVVVSDVAFQATSFDLDALDEPVTRSAGGRRSPRNTLERIAGRAVTRHSGGGEPPVVRWAATTVTLEVRVPGEHRVEGER